MTERIEFHHTPKNGSWLNVAEIELSALGGQCINRRIAGLPRLKAAIAAWENDQNNRQTKIDRQFKTTDVRIKLKRLYPNL